MTDDEPTGRPERSEGMSEQMQRLLQIRRLDDDEKAYATAEAFDNYIDALRVRAEQAEADRERLMEKLTPFAELWERLLKSIPEAVLLGGTENETALKCKAAFDLLNSIREREATGARIESPDNLHNAS